MDDDQKKLPPDESEPTPSETTSRITPAHYLRLAKANLKSGKKKDAFVLLQHAIVQFPDDPVVLSYFGCIQALVDKKYRSGIEACKRAILLLKKWEADDKEIIYAQFYLNLGRAYLAAGKKQDAITAFASGLKYDNRNGDLQRELHDMGKRKEPPLSFLKRSNPINKYIGILLHARTKEIPKAKVKK